MRFEKKNEEGCVTWIFCYNKMEIQLSKPIGVSLLAEIEVRKSPSFEPRTRFFDTFAENEGQMQKKCWACLTTLVHSGKIIITTLRLKI